MVQQPRLGRRRRPARAARCAAGPPAVRAATAASSAARVVAGGAGEDERGAVGAAPPHRRRATSAGRFLRRSTVPTASTNGPSVDAHGGVDGRLGGRHGERPEVDDLDPRRVEQLAGGVGGRLAGGVDHGPGAHAPAEDLTGPADVGRGLVRVTQEPAVVDRHDRRPAGRWDDVVGAVDDVGGAEPAVDTGVVTRGPQPVGDGGRERQPAHGRRRPGSEAQHVRLERRRRCGPRGRLRSSATAAPTPVRWP